MMNLSQHIERLLADNDCVIVPRLGGFITCDTPARWTESDGLYCPPGRQTAFNPRLTLNDGLLVQSYMAERQTDYAHALQQVNREVDKLLAGLHTTGSALLPHIGTLTLSARNTYHFTPARQVMSAERYGFASFRIHKLEVLPKAEKPTPLTPQVPATPATSVVARRRFRVRVNASFWSNAAAVAAILILFFAISIPVKNTETVKGNYAQLLPTEMFRQMDAHSLATTPLSLHKAAPEKPATDQPAPEQPAPPKEQVPETPAPTPVPAPVSAPEVPVQEKAPARIYHIIVASVGSASDARSLAADLVKQGHPRAKAIIGDGKMRVSIDSYSTEGEAYRAVNKLRGQEAYKNAWVLKKK